MREFLDIYDECSKLGMRLAVTLGWMTAHIGGRACPESSFRDRDFWIRYIEGYNSREWCGGKDYEIVRAARALAVRDLRERTKGSDSAKIKI